MKVRIAALFRLGLPILGLLAPPAGAQEQAPPPSDAPPAYSVAATAIGDLLDKPALKAVFEKHLPEIAGHPQVTEARALTLPEIVQYAPDVVTPDKLAAIDTELKALPRQ